jgi:DnaK suppressor protein
LALEAHGLSLALLAADATVADVDNHGGHHMTTEARTTDANRRDVLQAMLVALRDETYERIRELRHEQADDTELAPGDEMDRARAAVDIETHASLIARAEERLRYIDEALGRVEAGRYGICAGCREPIGVERLSALPFAAYCIECQQKRSKGHGWNDGTMIAPYDQQWTLPREMEEQPEDGAASQEVQSVSYGSPFAAGQPEARTARAKRQVRPNK